MGVNTGAVHGEALLWQKVQGTSGGCLLKVAEATGTATAAATFNIAVNVPSGALLVGHQLRVDTALSNNWDAAYATGSTTAISTNSAKEKSTKVTDFINVNAATGITTDVTIITITRNGGGNFTAGGVVRAIVYYFNFDAMPDAA